MSIVIALIIVLVVGALVANFYPKPSKPTLAQGEILIPEPEVTPESTPEIVEPLVETKVVEEPKVEAPKMSAKPKKKPQPKKKPTKAKVNA
jgi:outer membrane biosynthesis protein TonB